MPWALWGGCREGGSLSLKGEGKGLVLAWRWTLDGGVRVYLVDRETGEIVGDQVVGSIPWLPLDKGG